MTKAEYTCLCGRISKADEIRRRIDSLKAKKEFIQNSMGRNTGVRFHMHPGELQVPLAEELISRTVDILNDAISQLEEDFIKL